MDNIYIKLKDYNIQSALDYENSDRQYLALKKLWNNLKLKDENIYLSFIITNSLICYQLSWKWEDYWEEFSRKLLFYLNSWERDLLNFFKLFLPNSKNNKRFVNVKINRINKLTSFFEKFKSNELYYYENMNELVLEIARAMKQKVNAKTVVFAVKMFSYWARNCFWKIICFPFEISIPIDSRLIKVYEKYWNKDEKIETFYSRISNKLKIPELHLDAIIWNKKDLC